MRIALAASLLGLAACCCNPSSPPPPQRQGETTTPAQEEKDWAIVFAALDGDSRLQQAAARLKAHSIPHSSVRNLGSSTLVVPRRFQEQARALLLGAPELKTLVPVIEEEKW